MARTDLRRGHNTTAGRLSSRLWRVEHSMWMTAPILGFGLFTWVGFAYVGIRARRRAWWGAAIIYLAASIPVWILTVASSNDGPDSPSSNWLGGGLVALWFAGIVHAFLINRSRLRWRAAHHARPWYEEGLPNARSLAPPPGTSVPAPSPQPRPAPLGPVGAITGDRSEFFADRPAARQSQPAPTLSPPSAASSASSPRAPSSSPHPVDDGTMDVNTANEGQLRTLPGVNKQRARRALAERSARGAFTSTKDFADAIGLQPHEYARLRQVISCSPQPAPRRTPGRPTGRVVDF